MNLILNLNFQVDVIDAEGIKKAIEEAEKLYGPVDLLVNNAGVTLNLTRIDKTQISKQKTNY